MSNETQKDALIQALVNQRNQALNSVAELEAALFVANMTISEMDKKLKDSAELKLVEKE